MMKSDIENAEQQECECVEIHLSDGRHHAERCSRCRNKEVAG